MNQISAANNHTIHISSRRWRLLAGDKPTAEATPRGFRYGGQFARTRRLPPTGTLPREDIVQVVVGWQQKDESWHLGMILAPELAEKRGSRWCELVRWPDPDADVFDDLADSTGQHLAEVLNVPYHGVPRQPTERAHPPRTLPDPPLYFGLWTMDVAASGKDRLVLERSSRWRWQMYIRAIWYATLSVAYLVLSLATLTSDIALPNAGTLLPDPQFLPYLGIGTFVFFVGLMLYQLILVNRRPDRIIIDGDERLISGWNGQKRRWQVAATEVQSVYVSEVVRGKDDPGETEYGELNLHLGNGKFQFVLRQEEQQDDTRLDIPQDLIKPDDDALIELTRENAHSDLQATGLYIADVLGNMPVWYDVRVQ
jgi:hypothetical protein